LFQIPFLVLAVCVVEKWVRHGGFCFVWVLVFYGFLLWWAWTICLTFSIGSTSSLYRFKYGFVVIYNVLS